MIYMLFLIHVETCGYYAMSVYEGIGSNRWVYNGVGNAYVILVIFIKSTSIQIRFYIRALIFEQNVASSNLVVVTQEVVTDVWNNKVFKQLNGLVYMTIQL